MRRIIVLLALKLIIFSSVNVWAWNDEYTHQDLSEKAAEHSVLSSAKGDYLKNLGFDKNLEETFTLSGETKNVKNWIRYGSLKEDAGNIFTAYYYNHFHNPLALSWNQAGLSTCYPWINGMSSILWAQNSSNPWNWQKARDYYYLALTSSTNTQRNENFAKTFKGIGHITHLIQDISQPAHVRNDPHPLDDIGIVPQFENWAKDPDNQSTVSSFISNPVFPTVSLNTSVGGYVPITQLWDTDQYNGSNPPTGNTIGLSEYTNANFLSENTIFSSFTYPRKTDTEYYEEYLKDWGLFKVYRKYFKKTGGGEQIQHFVYAGRLYKYLDTWPTLQTYTLGLDNQCYKDYAQKLLPRAVGYSAGLLNYFFRGQINMEKDPNNSSQYVIKNESNEDMDGTFTLCYDDATENRKCFVNWNLQIATGQSKSVSFTAPTSPEPKEKGKYILVFNGTLGNENGAVTGKVVKLCGGSATITISGSDAPQNGSQYTATGGESPYTWTISKGSIQPVNADGSTASVTVSGQCGVATITVKDSCGNQTTKDIRLPSGSWVMVSMEVCQGLGDKPSVSNVSGTSGIQEYYSIFMYQRDFGGWRNCIPYPDYYTTPCPEGCSKVSNHSPLDQNGDSKIPECSPSGKVVTGTTTICGIQYTTAYYYKWIKIGTKIFEWRCP